MHLIVRSDLIKCLNSIYTVDDRGIKDTGSKILRTTDTKSLTTAQAEWCYSSHCHPWFVQTDLFLWRSSICGVYSTSLICCKICIKDLWKQCGEHGRNSRHLEYSTKCLGVFLGYPYEYCGYIFFFKIGGNHNPAALLWWTFRQNPAESITFMHNKERTFFRP